MMEVCERCGADKKEERKLGNFGCEAWGSYWAKHKWIQWTGRVDIVRTGK